MRLFAIPFLNNRLLKTENCLSDIPGDKPKNYANPIIPDRHKVS